MDRPSQHNAGGEETPNRLLVLPFRGEFGMKLVHHVPIVHAVRAGTKIVCHEEGEEALFPSADVRVTCERRVDRERRDTHVGDGDYLAELRDRLQAEYAWDSVMEPNHLIANRAYFRPEPFQEMAFAARPDVVMCPRLRQYGAEKNWPHWPRLCEILLRQGLRVMAAGAPDSSDRRLEAMVECTWTADRYLDRTIAAMRGAKVVAATDNGLAHLAVWCGTPLLLISYREGIVAPGPVRDGDGTIVAADYWPITMSFYQGENHTGSAIDVLPNSWDDPEGVAERVVRSARERLPISMNGPRTQRLGQFLGLAAAALVLKLTVSIVTQYVHYFPPDFSSGFLSGRERTFHGLYVWAFYAHILTGPLTLVLGLLLVRETLRRRWPRWHRRLGWVQVMIVVGLLAPSGLVMSRWAAAGPLGGAGLAVLAVLTGWTAVMGVQAARARRFESHRWWMGRCYVLLCSAVVLRLVGGLGVVTGAGAWQCYDVVANWVCWVVPLAASEVWMRWSPTRWVA